MSKRPAKPAAYTTHNLDEAAFLIVKGMRCKPSARHRVAAEFKFEDTDELERYRRMFWTIGAEVEIHSWLAVRQGLKNELRSQLTVVALKAGEHPDLPMDEVYARAMEEKSPLPMVDIKTGETYWYVDKDKLVVCHATFSSEKAIHIERRAFANIYFTKGDAEMALEKMKLQKGL